VYQDRTGNTLTVWFDDPAKEAVCEQVSDRGRTSRDRQGAGQNTLPDGRGSLNSLNAP